MRLKFKQVIKYSSSHNSCLHWANKLSQSAVKNYKSPTKISSST